MIILRSLTRHTCTCDSVLRFVMKNATIVKRTVQSISFFDEKEFLKKISFYQSTEPTGSDKFRNSDAALEEVVPNVV